MDFTPAPPPTLSPSSRSPLNWLNWGQAKLDSTGMLRFTKHMIHLR